MNFEPKDIATKDLHQYLLGSISPRPICFASTIDENGQSNLSPFSFFNVFGSNPATVVFSPARRVRNNTLKHTLHNAKTIGEVVIAVVNYNMVQQISLASCEYPEGVNEFVKAGFTSEKADLVKPFLVKESPVNMECRVVEIKETGEGGGAGNLIICEVIKMHIKDEVLDEDKTINPHKIDLVARMGKDFYCRASGDAVFEVPKPNTKLGIGFDQLPEEIRNSHFLTGNDLGMLANVFEIPLVAELVNEDERVKEIILNNQDNNTALKAEAHKYAHELLLQKKIDEAWQVLLAIN